VPAFIAAPSAERAEFWRANVDLLAALPGTRLAPVEVYTPDALPPDLAARSIATVAGGVELFIPAEGLFNVDTERQRAERELADASKHVQRLEQLLASDFAQKASPETVERERERLADHRERLSALERRRATLERLG
jgi:valyl-tRNA synthetase